MIFQSFGSFSGTSAGGVSFAAASATLPYVIVRPAGLCVMTLLAALHSAAGTPHALAAACTSITRAVAPPFRTYSFDSRMPRLPPVEKLPHGRLRTTLVPNGMFRPRVSPAPTAAVPMTNERRSIFGVFVIMAVPLCLRRCVNGFAHLLERTAAADVGDPRVDVGIGRPGLLLQQRRDRHDHPGLTV